MPLVTCELTVKSAASRAQYSSAVALIVRKQVFRAVRIQVINQTETPLGVRTLSVR
jgi:hypothetical protein